MIIDASKSFQPGNQTHGNKFVLEITFSALQCRLECESGYVAQLTPVITCVNGEYEKRVSLSAEHISNQRTERLRNLFTFFTSNATQNALASENCFSISKNTVDIIDIVGIAEEIWNNARILLVKSQ